MIKITHVRQRRFLADARAALAELDSLNGSNETRERRA
jgi:hypothetical protein